MKILTVVGARPQFIKAAPVRRALERAGHTEFLVHTGQHYDEKMSDIFFSELGIPQPDANLSIGSAQHGAQTGRMLEAVERCMLDQTPDWVLVYGDTNSTLAGAIAAAKLGIPIAHVEAGLRSFNRSMPEEHNRVLTDHCSDLLLCPTETAVANLQREGISQGVHNIGDVMFDAALEFGAQAQRQSRLLAELGLEPRGYYLATVHRAYNTDDPERLASMLRAFGSLGLPVLLPLHPRTRARLGALADSLLKNIRVVDPIGYLDMLAAEMSAAAILTDSGGVQKEAFFFKVPCFSLRPETEWVETVSAGWNVLVGHDAGALQQAIDTWRSPSGTQPQPFGDGRAATRIAELLATAR